MRHRVKRRTGTKQRLLRAPCESPHATIRIRQHPWSGTCTGTVHRTRTRGVCNSRHPPPWSYLHDQGTDPATPHSQAGSSSPRGFLHPRPVSDHSGEVAFAAFHSLWWGRQTHSGRCRMRTKRSPRHSHRSKTHWALTSIYLTLAPARTACRATAAPHPTACVPTASQAHPHRTQGESARVCGRA